MSVLLIFIDGLGIGTRGSHNPLDGLNSQLLSIFQGDKPTLPFGGLLAETDPRLGVGGLPQSATGQATILTGENAAALIGRHLNGFPSPRLRVLLAEHSIYKKLIARGLQVTFANAYTPAYFERRPRFVSATTVAAESAGVRLRTLNDLERGEAVFHDFTNRSLIDRGHDVPGVSAEEAGENLARLAAAYHFTLYEHFITDRIGHDQNFAMARDHLANLDRFIAAVLRASDLEHQTVVLTSDHGNIEDMRTRSHTLNDVATMVFGSRRELFASRIRDLTAIAPAIVSMY
jgi:2,3-bisphosphoglycerate-independent phosphoglycerate mutase